MMDDQSYVDYMKRQYGNIMQPNPSLMGGAPYVDPFQQQARQQEIQNIQTLAQGQNQSSDSSNPLSSLASNYSGGSGTLKKALGGAAAGAASAAVGGGSVGGGALAGLLAAL